MSGVTLVSGVARPGASRQAGATSTRASDRPSIPWDQFQKRARAIRKADLVPAPSPGDLPDVLPADQSAPLQQAVLLVPAQPEPGLQLAIRDLSTYLQQVTGKPVVQRSFEAGLPDDLAGATVIAIGAGTPVKGLVPEASGHSEGYVLQTSQLSVKGQKVQVIGLNGDDVAGRQYAVYRLMELSGKRFYSYTDTYTPPASAVRMPANGYAERYAPSDQMKVRGFAPHTYHPIPLSIAFHEPSDEHLAMMKRYLDWCVANRQNYVALPLLELDAKNPYLPLPHGTEKFQQWVPYAKQIVDYAHERGVQVAINVAFAENMSSNSYAINPAQAIWQSFQLHGPEKAAVGASRKLDTLNQDIQRMEAALKTAPAAQAGTLRSQLSAKQQEKVKAEAEQSLLDKTYGDRLDSYTQRDKAQIATLVDRLMQVPWDEIQWNLGTSEFTPTNDDLTIAWMNDAAAYTSEHYPSTRTTVSAHIPRHPYSDKYQAPYFDLYQFADPKVGALIHTTHAYSLTDPAPVYGNENFEHKLKLMAETSSPERLDVYFPETAYWVGHDANVPLFLPVYMLNRKQDVEILKPLKDMDGQVDFTTAWEWGYWLNDYAVARMQSNPDESLTQILQGAFTPFGPARDAMVSTMNAYMLEQQKYLIDKGLIRHMQGFDGLTDLGATIAKTPVVKDLVQGSNNVPTRLPAKDVMKWSASQVSTFEQGELADLKAMADSFEGFTRRVEAMGAQVPEAGKPYYQEMLDGYRITALRARLSYDVMRTAVLKRKADLTRDTALEAQARAQLADGERVVAEAMAVVRERESHYREAPEYNYEAGHTKTMWKNRYLTQVHTGEYWQRTLDEAKGLFK